MRAWRLGRDQLPSHILAADARFCTPNYVDDQIWELSLSSGEPAALSLRTTYGLRVRNMRMFPRFCEGDAGLSDPGDFAGEPVWLRFHPNYAMISLAPLEGLEALMEYWVPDSRHVGGRIRLTNSGVTPRHIRLDWVVSMVTAGEEGSPLLPDLLEGVQILTGQAAKIHPVVFLSGGAESRSSPSTALAANAELLPGVSRTFIWGHGAAQSKEQSFKLARSFATRRWDEETGRIEMINASNLDVETGNPDWDAAFALGQSAAYRLIHGPTEHLPQASFVHTRLPDQGFSLRGDGRDYDHMWNGQNMLETWHIVSQLLPSEPDISRGLFENFLHTQKDDGSVDWQPSLNGKSSGVTVTPMLCSLAWRIFEISGDQAWLVKYFPKLLKFIWHWFSSAHDSDQNGIPEWDHPMQTGYEDNPLFSDWQDWSQGANINDLEAPSLTGMLFGECRTLIRIAKEIQYPASIPELEAKLDRLRASLETSWDPEANVYRYRDRETHQSPKGVVLTRQKGSGLIRMTERKLTPPARLSLRIRRGSGGDRQPVITIRGINGQAQGIEEVLPGDRIKWALGWGTGITAEVYELIETIEVRGLPKDDEVVVQALDYRHLDQTLLAPLWAGAVNPESARRLVEETVTDPDRFWRRYGLAACATVPDPSVEGDCESLWIPWNCLIGSGLVDYGYTDIAAELVARMMRAVTAALRKDGAFRKHYHAASGNGIGERNAVLGLPPLDLFLKALGVEIFSIWRVRLAGKNPFPWPVALRFRGLVIQRDLESTRVTFPDGNEVLVETSKPTLVDGR